MTTTRGPWLRWLERTLFLMGLICLAWYSSDALRAWHYQREQREALDAMIMATSASPLPQLLPGDESRPDDRSAAPPGANSERTPETLPAAGIDPLLIGRIDVARLAISAIVRTGEDASTLRTAVGHLPGSPRPGQPGNVALAAHRDTFFRGLGDIRVGDQISITTADATHAYRVEKTLVVDPDDGWVLDASAGNTLTLITCYPFNFIGSAPRRFVVRAAEVSAPTPSTGVVAAAATQPAVRAPRDIALSAPAAPVIVAEAPVPMKKATARRVDRAVQTPRAPRPQLTARPLPVIDSAPTVAATARLSAPAKGSGFKRGVGKLFSPFKKIFKKR